MADIVPDYLNDEHQQIRTLLAEISDAYARAAESATLDQMQTHLREARRRQYDVEYRIHQAFTHQRRGHEARTDGG